MDVRRRFFLPPLLAFLSCLGTSSGAQSPHSKYDPGAVGRPAPHQQGFLDFTLQRINPAGTDYGQCIDEGRKLLLTETIDDRYFWSSAVGSVVLVCLFLIIVFQERRYRRSEWAAAEGLVQYEHALILARREFSEASKRNQELMNSLSVIRKAEHSFPSEAPARPTPITPSRVSTAHKKSTGTPVNGNKVEQSQQTVPPVKASPADGQIRLFNADGDLVMKINSQEQQIVSFREQVNLLRRQLTDSDRKLRAEQEKNRNLKGA